MKIGYDKIKHVMACLMISALLSTASVALGAACPAAIFAGLAGALVSGATKEYADSLQPGNRWDWGDVVADVIGAVIGSMTGLLALYKP